MFSATDILTVELPASESDASKSAIQNLMIREAANVWFRDRFCMFVDTVYTDVLRIDTTYEGSNYLLCDSIEEHLRFEQHRSDLLLLLCEHCYRRAYFPHKNAWPKQGPHLHPG